MSGRGGQRQRGRWLVWVLLPAALLTFVGANAHLVYVAVRSQPDCVAHTKHSDSDGGYRAAKSAC